MRLVEFVGSLQREINNFIDQVLVSDDCKGIAGGGERLERLQAVLDNTKRFGDYYALRSAQAYLEVLAEFAKHAGSSGNMARFLLSVKRGSGGWEVVQRSLAVVDDVRFVPMLTHPEFNEERRRFYNKTNSHCLALAKILLKAIEKFNKEVKLPELAQAI